MICGPGMKAEFDRCWPWLWASLCETGAPTHDKIHVWQRIVTGRAFLWPGKASVVLGEFIDHPIGFRSFNYWLQGGDIDELLSRHAEIEEWAVKSGCTQVTGFGRAGWSRVMAGEWRKAPTPRAKWLGAPPYVVRKALQQ